MVLAGALKKNVLKSDDKKFVAISSAFGSIEENASGGHLAYRSSKAALNMAWKNLAIEVEKENGMAFMIHPGWVKTRMGGTCAPLSTEESASAIYDLLDKLTIQHSGEFYDINLKKIDW